MNIVSHYCASGRMTYREFFDVARTLVPQEPLGTPGECLPEVDAYLRRLFCDALILKVKEIEGRTRAEAGEFQKRTREVRIFNWARQALLDGKCPICAKPLEEGDRDCHGYRGTVWDRERREFVQVVSGDMDPNPPRRPASE